MKDIYVIKSLKWFIYKRRYGSAAWRASYLFDRAVRSLRPGDVVLDCGANVGVITKQLAATGATVHAFEPDPYTFSQLTNATEGIQNVILHNFAVGTYGGVVKLYRAPDFDERPEIRSLSSSVFEDKKNISAHSSVDVQQIDLISFIRDLGSIKILKLDIEGAEVPVLEAIVAENLMSCIDLVFAETHGDKIPQLAERTAELRCLAAERFAGRINLDWG